MTSIYDIPYEDIIIFLEANNKNFKNDEAYILARSLLKDKKAVGHTINIIEWMIAFNVLRRKINIPNYTIYEIDRMHQNEINKLAKLLMMNGNNIDNLKNILRYLHKLDESVNISNNQDLTVAGEAIYNIILSNMENKTLNNMDINRYSKLYLEDQKFWKSRLNDIFGLTTNEDDFDYKFAVKFLDNGKTLDENYHEAMDKGLKQIIKLLLDNNMVEPIEPESFLDKIHTTLPGLGEIKNLSYNDFIQKIIDETNKIAGYNDDENSENEVIGMINGEFIDSNYINKIEFTGKEFKIRVDVDDITGENIAPHTKASFIGEGGHTNGEILYSIAQLIPNDNEIRQITLKYIKTHSKDILAEIENSRHRLLFQKNGFNNKNNFKGPSKEFLIELIKSPEKFLDLLNSNAETQTKGMSDSKNQTNEPYYDFLPDYSYYFGNHVYWEGLRKWEDEDEYHIMLGS